MKLVYSITILLFSVQNIFFCQGLNINESGLQTFYFEDPQNRNQLLFTNDALVESFNGITTDVWGEVSFDPADIQNSFKGLILTSVKSIKTGIELRDEDLYSVRWLEAEKYPEISLEIIEVAEVMRIDNNKLKLSLIGNFNLHGKTKAIMLDVDLILLEESELTKSRIQGDLLSIVSVFEIKMADFGIRNAFIPNRVSDIVKITINIVGTNKQIG